MRFWCIALLSVALGILGLTIACDFGTDSGYGSESSCYRYKEPYPGECEIECDNFMACPDFDFPPGISISQDWNQCKADCQAGDPDYCLDCVYDCFNTIDPDCTELEYCVEDCANYECVEDWGDDGDDGC